MRLALKQRPSAAQEARYPFAVPAIRTLPSLDVHVGVTFFVGENGSGKSSLLEAIAVAAELPALGSAEVAFDETLAPARELAAALRLAWSRRSRQGFFLRAEDFFGYHKSQARTDARIEREKRARPDDPLTAFDGAMHPDEVAAASFVRKYDHRSHGESFLDVLTTRVRPGALYLLDEPEAPLSPKRQIALLEAIADAADGGAQFIIATHSPILLACPGARIYSFDEAPIVQVPYDRLEHVAVTRDFLNDPARFLRR